MLILARHPQQQIVMLGGLITLTVLAIDHQTVRLGFDAPLEVDIWRAEVGEEK
jgi:carbon storage regulator CsrA